jgi:hypothetical protein
LKKRYVPIYSILAVAIVLLTALAPSCGGGGATTGTIVVQATLCGTPWQAAVNYTLTPSGGSPISGTGVPSTHSNMTATSWTCAYVAGGPAGAFLNSIKPTATQSLSAGGTITFTFDFELNQDAGIVWTTWTINGQPWETSSTPELGVCNVTDVHFRQWVDGCQGYNVTLNETDWLSIQASPGNPGAVSIYVTNWDSGLNKTAPSQKKDQWCGFFDVLHYVGDWWTLGPNELVVLDVHTVWQLVKDTNYTKSINWLGISIPPFDPYQSSHTNVLFELVVPVPGAYSFTLTASAQVDLVDDTDVNPDNDLIQSPPLTLNVFVPP